jgi:hypothetical protein
VVIQIKDREAGSIIDIIVPACHPATYFNEYCAVPVRMRIAVFLNVGNRNIVMDQN